MDQQFPWQPPQQQGGWQQPPQQAPMWPQQQPNAPPFLSAGQAGPMPQQQPPWMAPKMPPKGNPTKKKRALWYVLVGLALATGIVFIGTAIYYFMTY